MRRLRGRGEEADRLLVRARVYNACGSARQMRAVVDGWPDGPCEWVGAYTRADLYAGFYAPSGTADC
ncbi:hypothetical protein ACTMTI_42840 [Nonomuraea sp. H19]|uniref:hypothetical protein n=1 Tax=Nonomuraea sp. H19 TaxID=3452206 RepID=UPI003F8C0A21